MNRKLVTEIASIVSSVLLSSGVWVVGDWGWADRAIGHSYTSLVLELGSVFPSCKVGVGLGWGTFGSEGTVCGAKGSEKLGV